LLLTMSPEELQRMHSHRGQPRKPTVTGEKALAAHARAGRHRVTNTEHERRAIEAQEIRERASQTYPHGKSPRTKK